MIKWEDVPQEQRATEAQVREYYSRFVHQPVERAEKILRRIQQPVCRAAVALENLTNPKAEAPYIPCGCNVNAGELFCPAHGGKKKPIKPAKPRKRQSLKEAVTELRTENGQLREAVAIAHNAIDRMIRDGGMQWMFEKDYEPTDIASDVNRAREARDRAFAGKEPTPCHTS